MPLYWQKVAYLVKKASNIEPTWLGFYPHTGWCSRMEPCIAIRVHCEHAGHVTVMVSACLQLEFATAFHRLCGKKVLFPQGFHCTGMPIKVPKLVPPPPPATTILYHVLIPYLSLCHSDLSSMLVCFSVRRCIGCHTADWQLCGSCATRFRSAGSDYVQPT